jgi:hypothetical protein
MGAIASVIGNVANIAGIDQGNRQQQQGFANANGIINDTYGKARNELNTGYNNAQTNFNNQYTGAGNALSSMYPVATGAINQFYDKAAAGYQPYTAAGGSASNALGGLIDSGYATRQFNNQDLYNGLAPNYDFQLKQGQGNAAALANQGGGMLSGNALQGLNTFTQNFAGNAYQKAFENFNNQRSNIFGNLQPVANMGLNATNNLANVLTGQGTALSNLGSGYGSAQANLLANQGANLANMNIGQGQGLASTYTGQGNILAGNNITAGQRAAENTMAQYNQGGQGLGSIFKLLT